VALASALHRLRGLLGRDQAVLRQEGRLSLDGRLCWVDVWAVDHLLRRAETAPNQPDLIRKAAGLYQGPFLGDAEIEQPKATAMVESLRRRLLRQLVRVGRQREQPKPQEAVDWYEEALRVDPCDEEVCRSLMTTYHRLERATDVEATYRRCRAALSALRGVAPSSATQTLLRTLSTR
jgi:LuxR family transcriptional regulator, maltose regulon positive regulatory protein